MKIMGASSAHLKAVCSLLGPAARQNTYRQLLRIAGAQQGDSKKRLMDPLTFQNVNHPEEMQGKVIFPLLLAMPNSSSSTEVSSAVTLWARFAFKATSAC